MILDHDPVPDGHYWACERPEASPSGRTHYKRKCRACGIAFVAAALLPTSTFYIGQDPKVKANYGHGPAELMEWFMLERNPSPDL